MRRTRSQVDNKENDPSKVLLKEQKKKIPTVPFHWNAPETGQFESTLKLLKEIRFSFKQISKEVFAIRYSETTRVFNQKNGDKVLFKYFFRNS
jgi:hypothetical protein